MSKIADATPKSDAFLAYKCFFCGEEPSHPISECPARQGSEWTRLRSLLAKVRLYIECIEVKVDDEWGNCRSLDELIVDGDMPDLYHKVCSAIDAARKAKP